MSIRPLSRRTVLKGMAATISLPFLEAMMAPLAFSQVPSLNRFLVLTFPNGGGTVWSPLANTSGFVFGPAALDQVMAPFKPNITLFRNMNLGTSLGSPAHARASAAFLTGLPISNISFPQVGGVSVDQLISAKLNGITPFRQIHLGPAPYAGGNPIDTGWPSGYNTNVSWETPTKPASHYQDPLQLFNSCFSSGTNPAPTNQKWVQRKSVLDYVMDQNSKLQSKLGSADRQKMDEYMTSLRDVEKRIAAQIPTGTPTPSCGGNMPIAGGSFAHETHTQLMLDIIPLIFKCDLTRVMTYQMDYEFGGKDFTFLTGGTRDLHHNLTHSTQAGADTKVNQIVTWYAQQLTRLLGKLKAQPEGSSNALNNSTILYGCGLNNGHGTANIPMLLAGGGGGTLTPGKLVEAAGRPHTDLLRTLLSKFGVSPNFAGGSTTISGI